MNYAHIFTAQSERKPNGHMDAELARTLPGAQVTCDKRSLQVVDNTQLKEIAESMLFVEAVGERPCRWGLIDGVTPLISSKVPKYPCQASQAMVSISRHENCKVQAVWVRMGNAAGKAEEMRQLQDTVLVGGAPCRKRRTGIARDRRGVGTANVSRSANWPLRTWSGSLRMQEVGLLGI